MTCNDAEPQIARYADDASSLSADGRQELEVHLAACAICRAALDRQQEVAGLLRARLETVPLPGFVGRVSARIDRQDAGGWRRSGAEGQGWLGLANWRAWTAGIAPLAAALIVAAYIDIRGATSSAGAEAVPGTFEEWTAASAPAAVQPAAAGDALIEAVLTGAIPSSGDPDVR